MFRSYTDSDNLSFHDCRLTAISWNEKSLEFILHIDFISEWIGPTGSDSHFEFMLARSQLTFETVDTGDVQLNWLTPLECVIDEIQKHECRVLPNGDQQWRWTVEFFMPDAYIEFWSTGFQLELLDSPQLFRHQSLS